MWIDFSSLPFMFCILRLTAAEEAVILAFDLRHRFKSAATLRCEMFLHQGYFAQKRAKWFIYRTLTNLIN